MSVRTFSQEKQELLHIVMNEMEKRHFTVGEAEDFPEKCSLAGLKILS